MFFLFLLIIIHIFSKPSASIYFFQTAGFKISFKIHILFEITKLTLIFGITESATILKIF